MKPSLIPHLILAAGSLHAQSELFVTNFQQIEGTTSATGVWRNETTGTDLQFEVELIQSGGMIQPADGSSTTSILDPDDPNQVDPAIPIRLWQDVPSFPPLTPGIDVFEPNFVGDYINVETKENDTTTITLNLGATITDPIISFTDVEFRTDITFPGPVTKLAGTSNLEVDGATVRSDGTTALGDPAFGGFEEEAAGSVQLTGEFSVIVITIEVSPPEPEDEDKVEDEDRTGFVVSTFSPPAPLPEMNPPVLWIDRLETTVEISWEPGSIKGLQMSVDGFSNFSPVPNLDTMSTNRVEVDPSTLGDSAFFRADY